MSFPLLSPIFSVVHDIGLKKLFDDSSLDSAHEILDFTRSKEVDLSKLSCDHWFSYSFSKGAVKPV